MSDKHYRVMYHTQEHRDKVLYKPVKCTHDGAWLGSGYYFWEDKDDAHMWGRESKCGQRVHHYEIYEANIDCKNVFDTVFNEENYRFWVKQIEKAARKIASRGKVPTINLLNDYLKERGEWDEVDGIMFCDIPKNELIKMSRGYFSYKKRIQLAVYNLDIVLSFALMTVESCN